MTDKVLLLDLLCIMMVILSVAAFGLSFMGTLGCVIALIVTERTGSASDDLIRGLGAGFAVSFGTMFCVVLFCIICSKMYCIQRTEYITAESAKDVAEDTSSEED